MRNEQEVRRRWSELRALLCDWDPIGLVAAGAPPDEYDCVIGPLLSRLQRGAGEREIAGYLATEFDHHFGFAMRDAVEFSRRAIAWYGSAPSDLAGAPAARRELPRGV